MVFCAIWKTTIMSNIEQQYLHLGSRANTEDAELLLVLDGELYGSRDRENGMLAKKSVLINLCDNTASQIE
eukprot:Awhi_evm1s13644